jgi:two-component system nitrogen regulation response regulator GlnG
VAPPPTSALDADTLEPASPVSVTPVGAVLALTIVGHPDLGRVGQRAATPFGSEVALSRVEPSFLDDEGRTAGPLEDPHVSRAPIRLASRGPGLTLDVRGTRGLVRLDGLEVTGVVQLDAASLSRGVLVSLGDSVLLHVARRALGVRATGRHGLVGSSEPIEAARCAIDVAATHDDPVLLVGASGTGKEVVAAAIHRASRRASAPFVAINVAALSPSTAPAELFGHARGAFTGADGAHGGHFGRADGGTLFLDEIGDAPESVQPMLLRALETRTIEPVGGRGSRKVDVRVLAATDRDLTDERRFRLPLFHRLATQRIALPRLEDRCEDILPLFLHFLRAEGAAPASAGLTFALIASLASYAWPGNVRELKNAAKVLHREGPASLATWLATTASHGAPSDPPPRPARPPARSAQDVSDEDILAALERNGFAAGATARDLGIAKNTLYRRMARDGALRRGRDLGAQQIEECLRGAEGDLDVAAGRLGVSRRALVLRMRELGLSVSGGS